MAEKTLFDKLVDKLMATGLSQRKAKEAAKAITPVARKAVKAELQAEQSKPETPVVPSVKPAVKSRLAKFFDKVGVLPKEGPGEGKAELLQPVMGYTSGRTYLVAATKGKGTIVAIRDFKNGRFNVKFYPTFAAWGFNQESLSKLGATDFFNRNGWYDRAYFNQRGVNTLLPLLKKQEKKARLQKLIEFVTPAKLVEGFKVLYSSFS